MLQKLSRNFRPWVLITAVLATSFASSFSRPAQAQSINLALNRPATASSNETAAFTPNLAVDGNTGTRWSSAFSDPQWIRVDLGSTQTINRVVLRWEAAFGRAYQIQTSNDGTTWTTIFSTTTGNGAVDDLTGLSGSGRFIRMNGTARGTQFGYSLFEFEVFGSSGPTPTRTNTPSGPTPTRTNTPVGPTLTPTRTNTPGGPATSIKNIIPMPVSITSTGGAFTLSNTADIYVEPGTAEMTAVGQYLADKLNPSTGFGLQVLSTSGAPANGNLYLTTVGGDPALGDEGYQLTVTANLVTLTAFKPAGLFRGLQTIRQMLPATIERTSVQSGPWTMATGTVRDLPRFVWRGAMLDVARHFFSVANVKRFIDEMAYYKLNRFHIHLADDQGWRIMINSWPNLANHGGSTQVGGGAGGFYTQAQYADIVAYAQSRYIMVIPEIDMPGHTNAALASVAELNCNGVAPALYTGTGVGFSSLCTSKEFTYTFIGDVIRELAALTPGAYIHIGGDEAASTAPADYVNFINRVQTIVRSNGKQMLGWEEIAQAGISNTSAAQHWGTNSLAQAAVQKGAKVVLSPATKAYLDMKYDANTSLGLNWAGFTDTQDGYNWDPATQVSGVSGNSVLGLEAPLWGETIVTMADIEFLAFPRLAGHAEIGWSPTAGRNWTEYRLRLASHGPRLTAMGVNFYRDPGVPWQ